MLWLFRRLHGHHVKWTKSHEHSPIGNHRAPLRVRSTKVDGNTNAYVVANLFPAKGGNIRRVCISFVPPKLSSSITRSQHYPWMRRFGQPTAAGTKVVVSRGETTLALYTPTCAPARILIFLSFLTARCAVEGKLYHIFTIACLLRDGGSKFRNCLDRAD